MKIEHLKLFVRIASTHNISQAGKEMGLSAAVSSSYISKLEDSLGVKLIHRTTRKLTLTEEGSAGETFMNLMGEYAAQGKDYYRPLDIEET